jgi:hypothetical protein
MSKKMDEHRIPKGLLAMKFTGKRPRGRPQTRWPDHVKRGIERRG